ncbi:pyruvate kinase [Pneumocystis murina B123]|uniref:Pyruvate kinase n=1 Tax=Pneumocystis murina (strain B123) TaxID=1069680 RepID=M7NL19_PNEMU|nr:pyruvate kinase [Pneumocystis murina B123]EMR09348.1 pyruvate kinase [Pneumocystis murina B123]
MSKEARSNTASSLDINSIKLRNSCLSGIISTIGPSTNSVEMINKLRCAGVTIIRMNFSHGSYEYHSSVLKNAREAVKVLPGRPLAIALDTKGPEIRTGSTIDGKEYHVTMGHQLIVSTNPQYAEKCNDQILYVDYSRICCVVREGSIIYIDDGTLSLCVLEVVNSQTLKVVCLNEGIISSHKGVNLPGTDVDLPTLSEKDVMDLRFGVENEVDIIFASFIRSKNDIITIRQVLGEAANKIKIIAKIENKQGIDNFDGILEEADGIMVARGDLGIEIPQTQVFIAQKMMISKCSIAGKPSICATQMLEHMIKNPRPTRAEITDICTAILDGADCCMLSGETAKGLYPIESVTMMRDSILIAESVIRYETFFNELRQLIPKDVSVTEAICCAAVEAQYRNNAKAIILLSSSGLTARLCSKYRPRVPIIMVTRSESVARFSNLYRGVYPLLYLAPKYQTIEEWQESVNFRINWAIKQAIDLEIVQSGDNLVIIQGYRDGFGHSNTVKLHKIS